MSEVLPLITRTDCKKEVQLLIGSCSLGQCQSRIRTLLSAGSHCILVHPQSELDVKRLSERFHNDSNFRILDRRFALSDLTSYGRYEVGCVVDRVFVNLSGIEELSLIQAIYEQCCKLRIPINTSQKPEFSSFSLMSTYADPKGSGLQIAVSTNGKGCVLANRIKREVVSHLPPNISKVVTNISNLRDFVINHDHANLIKKLDFEKSVCELGYGADEDTWDSHKINKLVEEFNMTEAEQKLRRSRWLSQMLEYYPLSQLADLSVDHLVGKYKSTGITQVDDTKNTDTSYKHDSSASPPDSNIDIGNDITVVASEKGSAPRSTGRISLVGSGPGSVSMLTIGALHAIKTADLILADKLVPQPILDLIPQQTETVISKKFPGNAERAQNEFLERGLEALQKGLHVVRLKQGDPYIFGRGGEEYTFFKGHGYQPVVLPGLSSALAATVVADVPATMRGVADQVLICTGTGRKGALPDAPEYVETRTTIFLMALHRSEALVQSLLEKNWDPNMPAAIVERATCKDQRITRTLLKDVPRVVEEIGSLPPGLLIVGHAVTALVADTMPGAQDSLYKITEGFYDVEHTNTLDSIRKTLYQL